jgi:hypothetical protein
VALVAIGAGTIVVAVNLLAWAYLKTYPVNRGVSRVWQKWQMIEAQSAPSDVVIFGDSTCGQGIMPSVIEAKTGESALNLCTVANATAVNAAWQFEHYIGAVGAPRRAVFFFAHHLWERSADDLVTMFDQIPLERGFHRRLQPTLDLDFWSELEIATRPLRTMFVSNLSVDYVLSRELVALLRGQDIERADALVDLVAVEETQGYVGSNQANPERVTAQSRSSAEAYAAREFVMTPENEAALRAICAAGTANGVDVYLANSSISAMLYNDPGFRTFYDKMVTRLSQIVSECPAMKYIMKEPAQFPPEQMDNEDHVVTDAVATRLTEALIAAMQEPH